MILYYFDKTTLELMKTTLKERHKVWLSNPNAIEITSKVYYELSNHTNKKNN